jgi:pimeloyl-ACP methyl ester carboxylesterase
MIVSMALLGLIGCRSVPALNQPTSQPHTASPLNGLNFETISLENGDAPITLELAYKIGAITNRPAILMLGSVKAGQLPFWSTNLLNEGYMLAAFSAARPLDPDPARRPQWLNFDERFAHNYVAGGFHAPHDTGRIIDYLLARGDVKKIGWVGSSSTGIPGLSVATREPRLEAIVAFVSTGAYRQWLASWRTNKLWRGKSDALWPETEQLLPQSDPILRVDKMFPCAVLMVNGGEDKVVDPATARAFVNAARPFYQSDPDRLRLVIYEGFGHNLPRDIVPMYIENWFHLYLSQTDSPPKKQIAAKNLKESVQRTSITGRDHQEIMKAK